MRIFGSSYRPGRHISASEEVFCCKKCERTERYRWSKTYAEAYDQDDGHIVFQEVWYTKKDWLCATEDKERLFCWPCLFFRPGVSQQLGV